jgi:peptidyl-tRNA hydrolase
LRVGINNPNFKIHREVFVVEQFTSQEQKYLNDVLLNQLYSVIVEWIHLDFKNSVTLANKLSNSFY